MNANNVYWDFVKAPELYLEKNAEIKLIQDVPLKIGITIMIILLIKLIMVKILHTNFTRYLRNFAKCITTIIQLYLEVMIVLLIVMKHFSDISRNVIVVED